MEGQISFASSPSHPSNTTAGIKRKRDGRASRTKFYAVRSGRSPGIYHSWEDCLQQVQGFSKPSFKSFATLTEAQQFIQGDGNSTANDPSKITKWYGVRSGRTPGVYTSYADVLDQITGWKNPKHRGFKTRTEAERFVADGTEGPMTEGTPTADPPHDGAESADTSQPASKKSKKSKKSTLASKDEDDPNDNTHHGSYDPGEAPLPPNAQDNFDPTILLDPITGLPRYKKGHEQLSTKLIASQPLPHAPIHIYTDGSSLGNGTRSSISGVGVYFGPRDARNISEPLAGQRQTNQRAELTAILRALEVAPRDRRIVIHSDSNYAIKCATEWFGRWRANGWTNATGKPVENRDLVQRVIEMLEERKGMNAHRRVEGGRRKTGGDHEDAGPGAIWDQGAAGVRFIWVKGHSTDEGNNAADGLATAAAREAREKR